MSKVTREDLLNATSHFHGAAVVSYRSILEANIGVTLGEEITAEEIGEYAPNFLNCVFSESDRVIEVDETELYVAARFEDETEITFFALNEIED